MTPSPRWLLSTGLLLCLAVPACAGSEQGPDQPVADASSATASHPPPSRAQGVRQADELAVAGERAGGERGARLTTQAAELRLRLWRLDGRKADAFEAIELFRTASLSSWPGACDASLDVAVVHAELSADPAGLYRDVYRIRERSPAPVCRGRADKILARASAFRPSKAELAALAGGKALTNAAVPLPIPSGAASDRSRVVLPRDIRAAGAHGSGPIRIRRIEKYSTAESARIVVFINRPALFKTGYLAATGSLGPRLFVDIQGAKYRGKKTLPVGGIVNRVRIGPGKKTTRIVLDLEKDAYRRLFYLPEPFRLVIDISKDPPQRPRAEPGKSERRLRRVVLDPGHGGHDPGAIGPSGLQEKDVALDIAHRAAPLIARELGISTLLTRDSDVFVPLAERTARANAFHADLFVSIHCNASESGEAHGVMTFVLASSTDEIGSRIAARENSASEAAAAELATSLSQLADQGVVGDSRAFARLLQRSALASLSPTYRGVRDGGVKSAGFYVLAGAQMPAALYEVSFISNPSEEARLNRGDYRQKLADSIVNAVRAYKEGR